MRERVSTPGKLTHFSLQVRVFTLSRPVLRARPRTLA